jgi:hypothetical protein
MKSLPITQKCKSSPNKMNEAIVAGEAQTRKTFLDLGAEVQKGLEGDKKNTQKREPNTTDAEENKPNPFNKFKAPSMQEMKINVPDLGSAISNLLKQ